jgi:hypothetical protein
VRRRSDEAARGAANVNVEATMPQYMLLIYSPVDGGPGPEETAAEMPRWYEYTEGLKDAGLLVAGDPLHGVDSATTVRVRDGETQITDGPFAETKEFLGGYYIIDAPDLDTALQQAARVPNVHYGSIEVRPILDMSSLPAPGEQAQAQAQA